MSKATKPVTRFHAPLHDSDTPEQTAGCRYTNPDICARHSIPAVCAFVRPDGLCLAPPTSWPKQYLKLLAARSREEQEEAE